MKNYFKKLFDLQKGADEFENIIDNVKENSGFAGASLWILAFAIIIASVGLNMNSTAVIIGAMLISPLMGPIVGAGFGLALNEINLVKSSLKHLLTATIISLIVSTLYFFLSPFKDAHSELLSRISPTFYDVLIAFFGGLTGAITITRKDKGNPLPGVAIATALMPPLCTAGYGLATGNNYFFLGAMYLYLINCFFIFIGTIIIVKVMNYHIIFNYQSKFDKQIRYLLTFIMFLMIIPSIYLGVMLYDKQKFIANAGEYIEKEFVEKGHTVVYQKINYLASSENTIEIAFLKTNFTKAQIDSINNTLPNYRLNNTQLIVKSNNSQDLINMRNDLMNEVEKSQRLLRNNDYKLDSILNSKYNIQANNKELIKEVQLIIPEIKEIAYKEIQLSSDDSTASVSPVVIYKSKKPLNKKDVAKLKQWILLRYKIDIAYIYRAE